MSISEEGYIERIKIFNKKGHIEYIMKNLQIENEIGDNEKKYFE